MSNIKRWLFKILLLLSLFAGLFWRLGYYDLYLQKYLVKKNLSSILEKYATDMNNECPIAVGGSDELLIEKVSFKKEKTIVYEYKILFYSKDGSADLLIPKLKENLIEPTIDELRSIESLAKLRNNDVVFEYIYLDSQGEELFKIKLLFNNPIKVID